MSLFWIADNVNTEHSSKALILLKRGKKKRSNAFPIHTRMYVPGILHDALKSEKKSKILGRKLLKFLFFIFSIWLQQLTCAAEANLYQYTFSPVLAPTTYSIFTPLLGIFQNLVTGSVVTEGGRVRLWFFPEDIEIFFKPLFGIAKENCMVLKLEGVSPPWQTSLLDKIKHDVWVKI